MDMRERKFKKLAAVMLLLIAILVSWGGMIYAPADAYEIRPVGIFSAILGYGIVPGAVYLLER